MSLYVLLTTAGALGLLGGLHCIAMCTGLQRLAVHGASSGSPGPSGAPPGRVIALQPIAADGVSGAVRPPALLGGADLAFHAGRLLGYAALGALAGATSGLLRWGADAVPLMRPLWTGLNALLLVLGLSLLVLGRQPRWVDLLAARVWAATGGRLRGRRPWAIGAAWALVPCGLLYSGLATAALASEPLRGAAAMLAFGAGTAVNLLAAQAVLNAVARGAPSRLARVESIGLRLGGALLAGMAIAALVALALGQPHPFCAS
jgi:sulfite exporter TauE/SafE